MSDHGWRHRSTLIFLGDKVADGEYHGTFMLGDSTRVLGTLIIKPSVDQALPDELYCSMSTAIDPKSVRP